MKEEIEILIGPNGNKKEDKKCYGCNNYEICAVKEQLEKLVAVWSKVSENANNVLQLYSYVASDCKCYAPIKEGSEI